MKRFIYLLSLLLAIGYLPAKAQQVAPGADMYLDPNGVNSGNCSLTFPCATPGFAIKQFGKFWTLGQPLTVHFNPGNYNCPGSISGVLAGNLSNNISGTYVTFQGAPLDASGYPTTFFVSPPGAFCASLSNGGGVFWYNISFDTGTSATGIFCQNHSTCQIDHDAFVGTGYALHDEASALTEADANSNNLIINGNLKGFFTGGSGGGYLELDPGGSSSTITCGAGFTAIGQEFFLADQGAHILIGPNWSASGCGSVTGLQFILERNAVLTNCGNTACSVVAMVIPGSAAATNRQLSQGAQIYPVTLPTVSTSSGIGNGTIAVLAGSGPHGGIVAITAGSTTAASGSVTIAFGEVNTMGTDKPGFQCSLEDTATGVWLATAYPCRIGFSGEASAALIYNNNGTALTSGDVYNITYSSNGDN